MRDKNETMSRTPSRSPSPISRRRSYDSRSYRETEYSDDSFYSDDDTDSAGKTNKTKNGKKWRGGNKMGKNQQQPTTRSMDAMTKRMMSAKRMKINELKNEIESLNMQLSELRAENKTLRRQNIMSDRVLGKYEAQESDMGNIITRHNEEVRALREQLRKQKEKQKNTNRKLKSTEEELDKTRRLLQKMKGLVEDKQLKERDDLAKKLSKAEEKAENDSKKLSEMERYKDNLIKNHRHEIGIERARHKEARKQLEELQEQVQKLQTNLKEREKEIEVHNIYSMRLMKPPHRLGSVNSTPVPQRQRQRKNSDPINAMTPREKMKLFEDKRREEMRRKQESSLCEEGDISDDSDKSYKKEAIPEGRMSDYSYEASTPQTTTQTHKGSKERKGKLTPKRVSSNYPATSKATESSKSRYRQSDGRYSTDKSNNLASESGQFFLTQDEEEFDKPPNSVRRSQPMTPSYNVDSNTFIDNRIENQQESNEFSRRPVKQEITKVNSEDSVPLFDLKTSKQNNAPSKQSKKIPNIENEDSVPLFDLKNSKLNETPAKRPAELNLTGNPTKPEAVYRSYKDPKSNPTNNDNDSYKPTWLMSAPKKHTKKSMALDAKQRARDEERERLEREERERQERLEREFQQREERDRKEKEERAWWERNQREEAERKERAEREAAEEEERHLAERARQKEEAERLLQQQKLEEEKRRRQQEERKRLEEEERRRREEEERRAAEELARRAEEERRRLENDAQEQERQRQKQLLLAKMREIDDGGKPSSNHSSPSANKKDWRFTDAIENMHQGKPSHEVVVPVVQKRRKSKKSFLDDSDDDDIGVGDYKPTFTSHTKPVARARPQANARKSNLMDELFGDSPQKTSQREKSSSQIFGGGTALIDDDEPPARGGAHLLPKRTRQPTTTLSTRPTVNAVTDFEDDIEEMVL